jgi:hypothetical protein
MTGFKRFTTTSTAALAVAAAALLAFAPGDAFAAGEGQKGQGGQQAGQMGGGKGGGGMGQGGARGKGARSLESIFRDVAGAESEDEDSDRPEWAGRPGGPTGGGGKPASAGSKRGDLFGDLWVILRDDQGTPILSDEGFVQPIDENGDLIPLDEEGMPIEEGLVQEVELGRLNVGRAPTKVLDRRAEEVIALLNAATAIDTDAAGRLVLTVDGETKTIDSPLENLALYVSLMTLGYIPGVEDLPGDEFDFLTNDSFYQKDMKQAASFLAAATDKTGEFTTDEIAYINTFLGINLATVQGVTYSEMDFTDFNYIRTNVYQDVTAEVLVEQPDGSYKVETVNIYDTVFDSQQYVGSDTLEAFTQYAEDSRSVIEFIHEFAPPES